MEAIPRAERATHLIQIFSGAMGDGPRRATPGRPGLRRGAVSARRRLEHCSQTVDLRRECRSLLRCRLRINRFEIAPRVVQRKHRVAERQQRLHLDALRIVAIGQLELIPQIVVKQDVVNLSFLRHPVEIERFETRAPRRDEAAHPCPLLW